MTGKILLKISALCGVVLLLTSCASKDVVKGIEHTIRVEHMLKDDNVSVKPAEREPIKNIILPELPTLYPQQLRNFSNLKKPIRVEQDKDEKYAILNFHGADINTVISAFAEELNINYVLDPKVSGTVTVQTSKRFPQSSLFQVFQTILDAHGLTAVRDGGIYKIVPIEIARQQPLSVESGREIEYKLDSSFMTQIIPLEYVKASEILDVVTGLMPPGSDLIVYEPANILILTALPSSLAKFMKIINAIDIPYPQYVSSQTFIYYVENREAEKLAGILSTIYATDSPSGKKVESRKPVELKKITQKKVRKKAAQTMTQKVIQGHESAKSEILIIPYSDINALVIDASTQDYLSILETLRKLDIPTKQVLIEVLVVDIGLTDNMEYGIEWLVKTSGKDSVLGGFPSGQQPGIISSGFDSEAGEFVDLFVSPSLGSAFAAIIRPEKYAALLRAFEGIGKINIIASPQILAVDGKEAKIEIGDDVPVTTGFQQQALSTSGDGTIAVVPAAQIEYRTTGTVLNVLPRISDKNMVSLQISQEISERGEDVVIAGITAPSFSKRKAETTGLIKSGHTLIIGGLINERKSESKEGIPLLSNMPIFGSLFRTTSKEFTKDELVILVTPHVISSVNEADAITQEFQNKVKIVSQRMNGNIY
jgi:general secretion pathway protein D